MFTARLLTLLSLVTLSMTAYGQNKPNILIIWGDDIGQTFSIDQVMERLQASGGSK